MEMFNDPSVAAMAEETAQEIQETERFMEMAQASGNHLLGNAVSDQSRQGNYALQTLNTIPNTTALEHVMSGMPNVAPGTNAFAQHANLAQHHQQANYTVGNF